VRLFCHGRQGKFGQRLGDADDGFELADGDWNAGADVGVALGLCDAIADRDKVRRELLGSCGGEARCTPAENTCQCLGVKMRSWNDDLRLAETDVTLQFVHTELCFILLLDSLVAHVDAHDVLGNHFVAVPIVVVTDDKDHVKS